MTDTIAGPAKHVLDVAHLYRLALEKREAGSRYVVAEEGVSMQKIAKVIGRGMKLPVVSLSPEEVPAHFCHLRQVKRGTSFGVKAIIRTSIIG